MAKENNMNFTELYKRIRSIDESETQSDPAAARAARASMAQSMANTAAPTLSKEGIYDECGDMMGPSNPPKQQDSVTMSVNMNGNGSGGIKDLMNILKNIEQSANPVDPHPHNVDRLFGDGYENSEQGDQGAVTLDINDVVNVGTPINSGDHRPRQAGLPIGNPMQEALVSRLAQMYDEIKEAKEDKFDPLKHVKNPTKGEKTAAKDVKRGSYSDRAAMLKSAEADGRLKQEAYNPNSVDAEHRRSLEKSYEDTLKKKAAEGDESAKKRLQALKDKKERMRNDYNDRMER